MRLVYRRRKHDRDDAGLAESVDGALMLPGARGLAADRAAKRAAQDDGTEAPNKVTEDMLAAWMLTDGAAVPASRLVTLRLAPPRENVVGDLAEALALKPAKKKLLVKRVAEA